MKFRKGSVIAVSVACATVIALAAGIPAVSKLHSNKLIEQYTRNNLELYAPLNVITDCAEIDGNTHTLAGIKEAARLGADTVTVDLCFKSDGTPVVTDDYSDINENTLKAEEIFELMCSENYSKLSINFRLRQLSSLSEFNRLVGEYGVAKRVMISGIDSKRYSLISGADTSVKVYFDFEPDGDSGTDIEAVDKLISDYHLGGIMIKASDASPELIEALSVKGVPYIVTDVEEEIEMYHSLSCGAYAIETDSPQLLKEIHNFWKELSRSRLDASMLDELNK